MASEVKEMKESSQRWLSSNYYEEWVQAWKAYKCERDPVIDDETGKVDEEATSVSMPDTWAVVRKKAARITANIPNLRVRAADKARAASVGWKLMRDWDKGGVQRIQPRHVTQALIFGWSIRPWTWAIEEYPRRKKVDPYDPDPRTQQLIDDNYGPELQEAVPPPAAPPPMPPDPMNPLGLGAPPVDPQEQHRSNRALFLLEKYGMGQDPPLVPVSYRHKAYEGPQSDFLFIGDAFPEPRFQSLRQAKWLVVQRYRDESWMRKVIKRYPNLAKGFQEVIDKEKDGSSRTDQRDSEHDLRRQLEGEIGRTTDDDHLIDWQPKGDQRRWLIYEAHYAGENAKICYESESGIKIGEIPYPYQLDGRIAFTELVLIDDILGGIGDSDARIIRGLQQIHDRSVNTRVDLIHNIARPYVWTTNQMFYDDPTTLKRGPGLRLLPPVAGPNEIGIIGEQAAIAAAAASLRDQQDIQQMIQLATGESNLSQVTNQDPQQARTATGARILAYNQDVYTKQLNDAFTQSSLREDAEIMYLLNRSELSAPVVFDAGPYNRNYSSKEQQAAEQMERVTPLDFQADDDEILPEVGSTLADDDEAKVERATHMLDRALASPQIFNLEKARDEFLIAMGKGRELGEWVPPPAPKEPPMEPPRASISIPFEKLPTQAQLHLLFKAGLVDPEIREEAEPSPDGMPPGGPPPPQSAPSIASDGPNPQASRDMGGALNAAIGGQEARQ